MLRLKTSIWVKAYLRRLSAQGLMGLILRRGAEEAGAVFVTVHLPDRRVRLFAPAPGNTYDELGERRWSLPLGEEPVSEADVQAYLARQTRFDPDLWIVEVDDREGRGLLIASTG